MAHAAALPPELGREREHSEPFLYVLSGQGTFWMNTPADAETFSPGDLLFFKRGTVHALPQILSGPNVRNEPVVFLAIDTPRRDPKDIIFVNPEDGTPEGSLTVLLAQSNVIWRHSLG